MLTESFLIDFILASMRFSLPLVFAALGGYLSERAGVINIALEGLIMIGAFTAAAMGTLGLGPWAVFVCGGVGGLLLAAGYAGLTVFTRVNQIVAGTAVNMLSMGLIPLLSNFLFASTSSTPNLDFPSRLTYEPLLIAGIAVLLLWWVSHATPAGLWLKFAGENPKALVAAGLNIRSIRFTAVTLGGFFVGLGGATLSTILSSSYTRNISSGRGFMALAALILGRWHPLGAAAACLLFGVGENLQLYLQGTEVLGIGVIPVQFIQALPYLLTLLIVSGIVGEMRAPNALGK